MPAILHKSEDLLAHWRAKIQSNAREWESRNQSLFNEKVTINHHYQQLKASMDAFRGALGERLKQLSHAARTCEDALQQRLSKAETLLKLAERCRKLETEQEKILPFHSIDEAVRLPGDTHPLDDVAAAMAALKATDKADTPGDSIASKVRVGEVCYGVDAAGEVVEEWDYLNNFFKRYNKALLDTTAVDREATRLSQENEDLRTILKQYLDGISVNEEVMSNPINPLLVVNSRLQLTLRERDKARSTALQASSVQQIVRSS